MHPLEGVTTDLGIFSLVAHCLCHFEKRPRSRQSALDKTTDKPQLVGATLNLTSSTTLLQIHFSYCANHTGRLHAMST